MTPVIHARTVGERAMRYGAEHQATSELLATLTGIQLAAIEDAVLGTDLREAFAKLDAPPRTKTQRQRLAALSEWTRRKASAVAEDGKPLRSPKEVWALYAPRLEDLPVEEFHVAVLDAQHHLDRDITITRGILNSSLVHPREVFREAIASRAAAIILVHNHPSGDPTPSADDRAITKQLVAAGRLLDIPVADHIIIGRGRYISFAETGLL